VKRQTGQELSHEEVVNLLQFETVSYDAGFGIQNGFPETFRISIMTEPAFYEAGVAWLRDLLFGSVFNKER